MSKNKNQKKAEDKIEKEEIVDETIEKQSKATEKEDVNENKPTTEELLAQEKDRFLRLFAEFENYKRRTIKERLDLYKSANKELMSALLPVLDDFERALSEIKKAEDNELFKGVDLIFTKFRSTLDQKGLTVMEVNQGDIFDAEIHQAITQIPSPAPELKGKIIDVIEKGYTLGEGIVRFPKVIVGN